MLRARLGPRFVKEHQLALPTALEIAKLLLLSYEKSQPKRLNKLFALTSDEVRKLSGRSQLRGSVLDAVERILHRKHFYFFQSREWFLILPFGFLTGLPTNRMVTWK